MPRQERTGDRDIPRLSPGNGESRSVAVPRAGRRTENDLVAVAVEVDIRRERDIAVGAKRECYSARTRKRRPLVPHPVGRPPDVQLHGARALVCEVGSDRTIPN